MEHQMAKAEVGKKTKRGGKKHMLNKTKGKRNRSETKADKSVNDNTRKEERQNTSIKKNVV